MPYRLKKVLHVVEEKQAGVWRVIHVFEAKRHAEEFQLVQPERRQIAVYDRNEETLRPGKCLWVVESRSWILPWKVHGIYGTLLHARAAMSEVRQQHGVPRETRLLRFVRRKERKW